MKKIILAGGTGHLGKLLTKEFVRQGYAVVILSRSARPLPDEQVSMVEWDGVTLGKWKEVLDGADAVINLTGKSVQCRFTEANKKELVDSRILPTRLLGEAIKQLTNPPRLWINFSGISIFDGIQTVSDEDSMLYGTGFLADLSKKWEQVFGEAHTPLTHKVCLRVSPVLSPDFGMFKELYALAKVGLAGTVGDGKQCVPWIHEQDLVRLVCWIIQQESPSPLYHACAGAPVSNAVFMKMLRHAVGIAFGLPLPGLFAKIGAYFKGVESAMLLNTTIVTTTKTLKEGFQFSYPTLEEAFAQLTKQRRL